MVFVLSYIDLVLYVCIRRTEYSVPSICDVQTNASSRSLEVQLVSFGMWCTLRLLPYRISHWAVWLYERIPRIPMNDEDFWNSKSNRSGSIHLNQSYYWV